MFPVTSLFHRNPEWWKTIPDLSVFYPWICHCVCRGNPKGLSQRSHLFRRQAWQSSRLKGSMERSAGISWGSHRNALRCSPFGQNSPGACCLLLSQAGLFTLGRTFNPAQPWSLTTHVCFNCSYLFPWLPSFWSQFPPFAPKIQFAFIPSQCSHRINVTLGSVQNTGRIPLSCCVYIPLAPL